VPSLQQLTNNHELLPLYISLLVGLAVFTAAMMLARSAGVKEEIGRRAASRLQAPGQRLDATWQQRANRIVERAAAVFSASDKSSLPTLRRELIQAGFFSKHAVALFRISRVLAAVTLPGIFLLGQTLLSFRLPVAITSLGAMALALLGLVLPPVLLDARIRRMQRRYRHAFPDMMDLIVVCVESGQSMQSAFSQVSSEMIQICPPLGFNLHLFCLELRAGSTIDAALHNLHDRLGLDEVKSLAVLLKQSDELGSSIAGTLRVFSDEMRDKRLIRAETKANLLPVKMTIPLGLLIFPVILLVILLPVMIRIKAAFV
jgi:tight adherence protein C